jgi:hypothetical protein
MKIGDWLICLSCGHQRQVARAWCQQFYDRSHINVLTTTMADEDLVRKMVCGNCGDKKIKIGKISKASPREPIKTEAPYIAKKTKRKKRRKTATLSAAAAKKLGSKKRAASIDPRSLYMTASVKPTLVSGGSPGLGRRRR